MPNWIARGVEDLGSMPGLSRLIYDAGHLGRVAWFLGHAVTAARLAPPVLDRLPDGLPGRDAYLADLRALLRRDHANIEAGRYGFPADLWPRPSVAWRQSKRFLADLGKIHVRRLRRDGREVYRDGDLHGRRPHYFLQNFHYQTDGWLSDESAELYDFQVDVLFNGATDAMRRQALLPIGDHLKGRRIADLRLVDVACGTGRFLRTVKQNFPRLKVTGVDLSHAYLHKARKTLAPWSWTEWIEAGAEALPLADRSVDMVTSVYLLHELPRDVRRQALAEFARVLKPGGRLILVDSLQKGDHPPFDGLLDLFPELYHEPYYRDYVTTDLTDLVERTGLRPQHVDRAFMSKILVADRTT